MSKVKEPPKRTRRHGAAFDARLEVRMYSTELAKLKDEAKQRGMTASDLARFQLGDLIAAEPPDRTQTPDQPAEDAAALPTDLVQAIADGFEMSRGQATLQIVLGKVTVAGEPWEHEVIPADLLPLVAVSGEPLPVHPPDGNGD